MGRQTVCVVGSLNVDTTFAVRRIPGPGETILADGRQMSHGGKGANQAAAVAAAGGEVALIGAVGNDENGVAAVHDLEARGVDVEGVAHSSGSATGSAVILVADGGENLIVVDPGANRSLDPGWTADHVERLNPVVTLAQLEAPYESLVAAAQAAPTSTFILNPAPIPPDVNELDQLLALADVLVPNRTELGGLVGRPEPTSVAEVDSCAAALSFHGTLVVTLGADGAIVYEGSQRRTEVPAMDVLAVDTSGAGDVFCGGLAHRLALGDSIGPAVSWASEVAGISTTYRGARMPAGAPKMPC